ncbi:Lar family restriction alleviation protein [Massilia sp. YIM B02769]|uniref:Lar family restriction alleviation protein n=1 Tax=Massilia sp. YIM B02769 TaxID=3050129 RepID=UPI0025B64223|nr:Lar family restriction alleviation protein [Massilia sp. YIM B02769]MDN4061182.1 Lar family restriction alleviation protein [Massilia sp. YIM B02769]
MSEELKPCPFCGSKNLSTSAYDVQPDNFHNAYVTCGDCEAQGAQAFTLDGWLSSKDEAISEAATAWNRRTPAEQPAPASTGREHDDGCDYSTSQLPTRCTCKPRSAPVAARELDVEAERREFLRVYMREYPTRTERDAYKAFEVDAGTMWLAARSAAQGTAPVPADAFCDANCVWTDHHKDCPLGTQAAPVSTEQAGDAWISVEDQLPEAGKWVIVSHRTEYVNAPPQQSVSTALFDGAYWWNHGHHIYTPTHWQSMPAAPSPNNSPVGADRRE